MSIDSLEALQGLHKDLQALAESRLANVQRLSAELEENIEELRNLLKKRGQSSESRVKLESGCIEIDGESYTVNRDFQDEAKEVAAQLDLDEIETAKLFLRCQSDERGIDRSLSVSAVIRFHHQRFLRVECLRLVAKHAVDQDADDTSSGLCKEAMRLILNFRDGNLQNGSAFFKECTGAMATIESSLQGLGEQILRASMVGTITPELTEILEYQRSSLLTQHESLAALAAYVVHGGFTTVTDLDLLLSKVKTIDKHDTILLDYIPMVQASIAKFGGSEGSCSDEEAASIYRRLKEGKEQAPWGLRNFWAATLSWWLAEYSARFADTRHTDRRAPEAQEQTNFFEDALKDGGFHFMLSVCRDIRRSEWYDPAKIGLVDFLLHETVSLPADAQLPSEHFQVLIMSELQTFSEAFITNMPDEVRRLKYVEDGNRRHHFSRQRSEQVPYELHLERFLVITSYAFESSADAAADFWSDQEGNLFGFLQWAAKRQTTPRVAAFCELLLSISENEECADATHRFLLEEGIATAGKLRRTASLSWEQLFRELNTFAENIRDQPAILQNTSYNGPQSQADKIEEPESAMMLECYLRLVAHLCRQSHKARDFVLRNPDFQLQPILLHLCSSDIKRHLRACAFNALASLLTDKSPEIGGDVWVNLDRWVRGTQPASSGLARPPLGQLPPERTQDMVFRIISSNFEESNSFVGLLHDLVQPYSTDKGLNDRLPFPESLGQAYRMPGIDAYIDFILGTIFSDVTLRLTDPIQQRILRLNCLKFMATCLSTFNEDLVILANRSNIPIDATIETSTLAQYVRLHPFARVMEWLFNDSVLKALFLAAQQNVEDVNSAASGSPFVLSIAKAVEIMILALRLQPTYLDIVRPLVNAASGRQAKRVANPALMCFEDAILNRLSLVVDLGLYCGTGHQELTVSSLTLLERLSTSRKLALAPTTSFGQRADRSKLLGILEKEKDHERISRALAIELELDSRELEVGSDAPGYVIKNRILGFLKSCLVALPDRPTVAHLLLGFSCSSSMVSVQPDSPFANGISLFHSILKLWVAYPDTEKSSYSSWRSTIRQSALEILKMTWQSPLTQNLVMAELRSNDFAFLQSTSQTIANNTLPWDGLYASNPDFLLASSAMAFRNFLLQRTAYYDYTMREMTASVTDGKPTLRVYLQSALLGMALGPTGEQIECATLFELFDFVEISFPTNLQLPPLRHLTDLDLSASVVEETPLGAQYDLKVVKELLLLLSKKMKLNGHLLTPETEQSVENEIQLVSAFCLASNQRDELVIAQHQALRAWTKLVATLVEFGEWESSTRNTFVLQALQITLPRLEQAFNTDIEAALELTALGKTLLRHAEFRRPSGAEVNGDDEQQDRPSQLANDRLFQLFRASLSGVFCIVANVELRELCYQNAYRYLREIVRTPKESPLGRHAIKTIKMLGVRLFETACDDAYAGKGTCKISALLLLDSFVALGNREGSKYVIDAFGRLNFISVVVDSIKSIPYELRNTSANDIPALLAFYTALLALLLRISQTRHGAAHVLNAGLLPAVRSSQIFSADPDIGFEIENTQALKKFFQLMLSLLRVINAVVVSRGTQNDQTLTQAREFLQENRGCVVSIFKRNAGIGGKTEGDGDELNELVDQFTLLVSATGFMESEEKRFEERDRSVFS